MNYFEDVILKRINAVLRLLATLTFVGMVFSVLAQVVIRYCTTLSIPWTEEAARFLFIWATFLGAGLAFAEGGHLGVKVVTNLFKTVRGNAAIRLVADFFCLWFLGMYVWEGFKLCSRLISMGQTSPAISWLLMGVVYLAIPVGSVFMILNILPHAARRVAALVTGVNPGENVS
jgi:TRAP-type C4-dicarboxylate transport system permease small subunit